MMRRLSFIGAAAGTFFASVSCAQTVPRIAVDLALGVVTTTQSAGATWFQATSAPMVSADLAVRLGGPGHTGAVIVAGYSVDGVASDRLGICNPAPTGSCKEPFPTLSGLSFGVGLKEAVGSRWLFGATVGVASYSSFARFADLDASWRFASHTAFVAKAGYFDMPFDGGRARFNPLKFGVRLVY